jgi:uncharacterized protein (DUF983 family)
MDKDIKITYGYAVNGDNMHWFVNCPNCGGLYEFEGYFNSASIEHCEFCGENYKVCRVWLDENKQMYIE